MNCKKIRSYFHDYADDTIEQGKRSAIEIHLAGCAACRLNYETQRRLHQSIKTAAASELACLHFQPASISPEPFGAVRRASVSNLVWRIGYAAPVLLLLLIILWPRLRPASKNIDDPIQAGYAEAFEYLQMYSADSSNPSRFAVPVVVIIQPGAPSHVIELDGTTDISTELK